MRLLQEEHGCLERGACSLWTVLFTFPPRIQHVGAHPATRRGARAARRVSRLAEGARALQNRPGDREAARGGLS